MKKFKSKQLPPSNKPHKYKPGLSSISSTRFISKNMVIGTGQPLKPIIKIDAVLPDLFLNFNELELEAPEELNLRK